MPVTPISKIDAELGAATLLQQKKRGTGFKRGNKILTSNQQADEVNMTIGKAIILARANIIGLKRKSGTGSVSNFNVTTGGRYALTKEALKGANAIRDAFSRMVKNRHSASGFFKTCAHAVQLLFQHSDRGMNSNVFGAPPTDSGAQLPFGGKVSKRIGKIAGGTTATDGPVAHASFWVSGTQADNKGALQAVAQPVWEKAISDEAAFMRQKTEQAYIKSLKQAGFTVK